MPTILGIYRHHTEGNLQSLGYAYFMEVVDKVQGRLSNGLLRKLVPVRALRWLERQGLSLSKDFVRYDFQREGWVLQA